MRKQWILIDKSFLKTIRTIETQIIPSRGEEKRVTHCRQKGKGPLIYDNKGFTEISLHYDNTFTAHA